MTFTVPESLRGRPVRILFAGVDEQAWVYVNGHLVREHTEASEGTTYGTLWESPFVAEIPADKLSDDGENVLAVKVHNQRANGGIWRPVLIHLAE